MPRKIFKAKFDAIRNDLLNTTHPQQVIGQRHAVSASTVSAINIARTWGNYLNGTTAKTPLRAPVKPLKASKVQRAKDAGLHPHDREDRETERLDAGLKKMNATETINTLQQNLPLYGIAGADIAEPARKDIASYCAIGISVVAFILSVIAIAS